MNDLFSAITRLLSGVAFWVIVSPWEQGLRVRAGRHVRLLHGGLYLRIPIIDTVYRQTTRRRNALVSTQTLSTADGKTVSLGASLGYAIGDIEKLYNGLHDAEDTIVQIAAATLADIVLTSQSGALTPNDLGERATATLAASFEAHGINGVELRVTDFAYIRAVRLVMDQRWGHGESLNVAGTAPQ